MDRRVVRSAGAPAAIGPYSQAIVAGGLVFTAGQIALDPATGEMVGGGDVRLETERVLANLEAVLAEAGCGFGDVVKATLFLVDMADFGAVNAVYGQRFGAGAAPARSTVAVAALPRGARIEIEFVACVP